MGALFSCRPRQGPNETRTLWERMLDNCRSTEAGRLQAQARQAGIAAATRALHHQIGVTVIPAVLVVAMTRVFTLMVITVVVCEKRNVLVWVRSYLGAFSGDLCLMASLSYASLYQFNSFAGCTGQKAQLVHSHRDSHK